MPLSSKNYVLDVYQQRMETVYTVQHPCKVIVMDHGFDASKIFIYHCEQGSVHKVWISISDRKVPRT